MAWRKIYTVVIFANASLLLTLHNGLNLSEFHEATTSRNDGRYAGEAEEVKCYLFHENEECKRLLYDHNGNNRPTEIVGGLGTDPRCSLENLARNCSKLIADHAYVVSLSGLSEEEELFPLAFGLKMHTAPEQAEQLLRTIYRPNNVYCIYIDGKAPDSVYNTMKMISKCFNNVHLIEDRIDVVYTSIAHVHSELQCMRMCIQSKVKWKYYINLAGQEFPLKTNLEIVSILKVLKGKNDIESYTLPYHQQWRQKTIFEVERGTNIDTTKPKEAFKYKIELSKGSAYGSFSRKFIEFVLTDGVARDFISWLNNTYAPEETVWATLNTLPWSPGGTRSEVRHTRGTFLSRAMIWQSDNKKCHGKFVRSVCVYGGKDFQWLAGRPHLIANKFNRTMDPLPIDCLEMEIRRRTKYPDISSLDWYYYQHIPQAAISDKHYAKLFRRQSKKVWLSKQISQRGVSADSYTGANRLGHGHDSSVFFVFSNGSVKYH